MLTAVIIAYVILIFPIYINGSILYKDRIKKIIFSIKLFGFIKIFNGYIKKGKEGLNVYFFNKKHTVTAKDLLGLSKSIEPIKDYHFLKIKSKTKLGLSDNLPFAATLIYISNFINNFCCWFFTLKKPQLNLKNDFILYEGQNIFETDISVTMVLNINMIIISIIKIITEKIFYGQKVRKQQV